MFFRNIDFFRLSKNYLFFAVMFLFINVSNAQFESVDSINKVIFKKFSPPVSAVIEDMLYTQAKVFEASDINSKTHNLSRYRGKPVLIYFWNIDCDNCMENLIQLDSIQSQMGDKIVIFAFADEGRDVLRSFFKDKSLNLKILYKGKMLGEFMYGGSLGYPRLFFIDKNGYIARILPKEYFNNLNAFDNLKKLIADYVR